MRLKPKRSSKVQEATALLIALNSVTGLQPKFLFPIYPVIATYPYRDKTAIVCSDETGTPTALPLPSQPEAIEEPYHLLFVTSNPRNSLALEDVRRIEWRCRWVSDRYNDCFTVHIGNFHNGSIAPDINGMYQLQLDIVDKDRIFNEYGTSLTLTAAVKTPRGISHIGVTIEDNGTSTTFAGPETLWLKLQDLISADAPPEHLADDVIRHLHTKL